MKTSALYGIAMDYAETVKKAFPAYVADDAELCLIQTADQEMFTGVTSVRIEDDEAVKVSAEENCINSMISEKNTKASQMITVSIADGSVKEPSEDIIELLIRANITNRDCGVAVSKNEEKTVVEFLPSQGESESGAPAEFVSGFEFDESNPFFEAEGQAPEPTTAHPNTQDPKFLYNQPGQGQPQQGGFQGQNMGGFPQQGYPQQGMNGYPQQGMAGYPQQGMNGYPQQGMGGYPQQGMNGYPQQGMNGYPQQGMAGFPQQGMNGYPQQGMNGYPQQGMNGFPQQNQSAYMGNPMVAAPVASSGVTSAYQGGSVQLSRDQSAMVSQFLGGGGGSFKKRLASFMDDDDGTDVDAILDDIEGKEEGNNNATMSRADMKKAAEMAKKQAKQNQKKN